MDFSVTEQEEQESRILGVRMMVEGYDYIIRGLASIIIIIMMLIIQISGGNWNS